MVGMRAPIPAAVLNEVFTSCAPSLSRVTSNPPLVNPVRLAMSTPRFWPCVALNRIRTNWLRKATVMLFVVPTVSVPPTSRHRVRCRLPVPEPVGETMIV
jgi:hypothetical protein